MHLGAEKVGSLRAWGVTPGCGSSSALLLNSPEMQSIPNTSAPLQERLGAVQPLAGVEVTPISFLRPQPPPCVQMAPPQVKTVLGSALASEKVSSPHCPPFSPAWNTGRGRSLAQPLVLGAAPKGVDLVISHQSHSNLSKINPWKDMGNSLHQQEGRGQQK